MSHNSDLMDYEMEVDSNQDQAGPSCPVAHSNPSFRNPSFSETSAAGSQYQSPFRQPAPRSPQSPGRPPYTYNPNSAMPQYHIPPPFPFVGFPAYHQYYATGGAGGAGLPPAYLSNQTMYSGPRPDWHDRSHYPPVFMQQTDGMRYSESDMQAYRPDHVASPFGSSQYPMWPRSFVARAASQVVPSPSFAPTRSIPHEYNSLVLPLPQTSSDTHEARDRPIDSRSFQGRPRRVRMFGETRNAPGKVSRLRTLVVTNWLLSVLSSEPASPSRHPSGRGQEQTPPEVSDGPVTDGASSTEEDDDDHRFSHEYLRSIIREREDPAPHSKSLLSVHYLR